MKRYLYLWHRWLGIALCLVMALWFVSGVVMLYVGYPKLTPSERLRHLPLLPADCCTALDAAQQAGALSSLRLTSIAGQAHYVLTFATGERRVLNAASGKAAQPVDAERALAGARQFGGGVPVRYLGEVDEDIWAHSRGLDGERPLHRVELQDEAGTWLYLSSRSGEVVLDASQQERHWNLLGAWLHWLYPLRGGFGVDNGWRVLVIGLSLAGTLMAVLGIWVGVLRWRFQGRYRSGSHSPYGAGWMRWHHVGGLLFGVLLVLWVFSGLMSMRPWGLFDGRSTLNLSAYPGGALQVGDFPLDVSDALAVLRREPGFLPVELEWRRVGGEVYLVARTAEGDSRVLAASRPTETLRTLPGEALLAAAQAVAPDTAMHSEWLERFDFHYFARAEQSMYGFQHRRLPVLRVRFDDAQASWLHIDPHSGAIVDRTDQHRRAGRWLFNLLHSWDWQPLLERPRLREALIIAFSAGGLFICLSGTVLGWRRLRRDSRLRRKALARRVTTGVGEKRMPKSVP
ncbi:MAG: PepSY domain-containing protein [Pseudomonas sp.]|uniref:PepSY domain-containing protein n=1 Tax=Pseudomonas sp. TaxID=306 RepID=UPI003D0ACF26